MDMEQPSENRELLSEQEAFQQFWEALNKESWMTDCDGEDHCANCWSKFINRFDKNMQQSLLEGSVPTSRIAKSRKLRDAWGVYCWGFGEGSKCEEGRKINIPFKK